MGCGVRITCPPTVSTLSSLESISDVDGTNSASWVGVCSVPAGSFLGTEYFAFDHIFEIPLERDLSGAKRSSVEAVF
ncbi:MAG: hypothetical protein QG669_72 [Patescibacteria group bacterium]|nr:hypothetical protein [Patescibacteria group bacterium]